MAKSDGAAVDVEFFRVDAELFDYRQNLTGERFIDLDEIDLVELHARFLERDLRGGNRANAHDVGIATCDTPRHDPAQRLLSLRIFCGRYGDHRGAVDDAAGVA